MSEKFPNLMTDMNINTQKAQKTPERWTERDPYQDTQSNFQRKNIESGKRETSL